MAYHALIDDFNNFDGNRHTYNGYSLQLNQINRMECLASEICHSRRWKMAFGSDMACQVKKLPKFSKTHQLFQHFTEMSNNISRKLQILPEICQQILWKNVLVAGKSEVKFYCRSSEGYA